jgi:broad specificity phosphatase PhoE
MRLIHLFSGQKILSTLLSFALFSLTPTWADDNFSIYLVRHAEKQSQEENPSLTSCGLLRAKQLASLLSQANIKAVYSSSYQRTRQTAHPLASLNKLAVKNYNPKHLPQLALQLKKRKENALVVGHSNTTPLLTELLSKQKVASMTEEDYQFLYQVQFTGKQNSLTLFKQPLLCKN